MAQSAKKLVAAGRMRRSPKIPEQRPTTAGTPRPSLGGNYRRRSFEKGRWPEGRKCPKCRKKVGRRCRIKNGKQQGLYRCPTCGNRFTATSGTFMHGTHLPLDDWWYAFGLVTEGRSVRYVQKALPVGSYQTAWRLSNLIRDAWNNGELRVIGGRWYVKERSAKSNRQQP